MIPPCFYRVSVKSLILDEQNRFLLAKEPDGKWDIPGGGLEFGENPIIALRREILEELGLVLTILETKPMYITTYNKQGTDAWMANIFYKSSLSSLDFKPSDECIELQFFSTSQALNLKNNGGVNAIAKELSKTV